jgi:hypothetical protein
MESNNIGLLPTQYKLKNKPEQVESQKHWQECTNNFTKKCPKNVCLLQEDLLLRPKVNAALGIGIRCPFPE